MPRRPCVRQPVRLGEPDAELVRGVQPMVVPSRRRAGAGYWRPSGGLPFGQAIGKNILVDEALVGCDATELWPQELDDPKNLHKKFSPN